MNNDAFCKSEPDLQERLRTWFCASPGEVLLAQERECLEQLLPDLYGYYLVQLGFIDSDSDLSGISRFRTHLVLDTSGVAGGATVPVLGDSGQLPVATDSVDAVMMPHTLDFSPDPHQVLREAERILIPEGRLIILGFNPWSLWGLWRLLLRRSGRIPWCGQFLALRRLYDWLSLLGFDVIRPRYLMFRPPLHGQGLMRRLAFMERLGERCWSPLAGVYLVQAVKRVSTMTPLEPAWKARARLLGGRVVEPTTRHSNG